MTGLSDSGSHLTEPTLAKEAASGGVLLWHGLLTVPRPGPKVSSWALLGDLRSCRWHGQETVPQRGGDKPRRSPAEALAVAPSGSLDSRLRFGHDIPWNGRTNGRRPSRLN